MIRWRSGPHGAGNEVAWKGSWASVPFWLVVGRPSALCFPHHVCKHGAGEIFPLGLVIHHWERLTALSSHENGDRGLIVQGSHCYTSVAIPLRRILGALKGALAYDRSTGAAAGSLWRAG
jgi:hypothetical protein